MVVRIIENEYTKYIEPLEYQGMKGRTLYLPARNGGTLTSLVFYGHHTSLERYGGFADILNDYGEVYMPDMPGLGGMDSFYSVRRKPTFDAYADYMADFIRERLSGKTIHIFGVSFGFVVATRMLQRHPDLAAYVKLAVSIVGFTHSDDFSFSPIKRRVIALVASAYSHQPLRSIVRYAWLNAPTIRLVARTISDDRSHFRTGSTELQRQTLDYEVFLWHVNDMRTQWNTLRQFMELSGHEMHVNVPVWHVDSDNDRYFNREKVITHLEQIYSSVSTATIHTPSHAPSILGHRADLEVMMPESLMSFLQSEMISAGGS